MMAMIELDNLAMDALDELLREARGIWNNPNAKYAKYRQIEIDKRGSFGERLFKDAFGRIYHRRSDITYQDGDQGDWDIKLNGWKFEVKTSSLDVNKKFQNEGLKQVGDYDGVMFLGVAPEQLFVKFVKKDDIPFDELHNREQAKTGRGWKWDFKLGEMTPVDSLEDIQKEFEKSCPFAMLQKK